MKWKKKFNTFNLLAGLTVLMFSACNRRPQLQIISTTTLPYPSASGMEFFQNRLYVFGDNAPNMLVLTTDFHPIKKISFWPGTDFILSKEIKPDIESVALLHQNGAAFLVGVGSMSGANRWVVYEYDIEKDTIRKTSFFHPMQSFSGIEEINIEGSTFVDSSIVFCNRANLKTKKNHLLYWNGKEKVVVKELRLPFYTTAGLSGLAYNSKKDVLFFTASEEATFNAIDDGAIGESYLGWIDHFSEKKKSTTLSADALLKLTDFSNVFAGQKIEAVCIETAEIHQYRLHLAADNDNGSSTFFTVNLSR